MIDKHWPVFVLSLKDQLKKRENIKKQLNAIGLNFEFIDAIDGRSGLPQEYESRIDRIKTKKIHGYGMSEAEFACALSHQIIYEKIIEENLPGAVIFEDDAILTKKFSEFYNNKHYECADLIQFFWISAKIWKFGKIKNSSYELCRLAENAWFTVGYSVSRNAAILINKNSFPICRRADWPCNTHHLVDHRISVPRLVLHPLPSSDDSTIKDRDNLLPENFDFSTGYAKGWRRLLSAASWGRLISRPFKEKYDFGFDYSRELN